MRLRRYISEWRGLFPSAAATTSTHSAPQFPVACGKSPWLNDRRDRKGPTATVMAAHRAPAARRRRGRRRHTPPHQRRRDHQLRPRPAGCVPFLTGLLAVIFGVVGMRRTRDRRVGGRGLAIAGLCLGIVMPRRRRGALRPVRRVAAGGIPLAVQRGGLVRQLHGRLRPIMTSNLPFRSRRRRVHGGCAPTVY